MQPGDITIQTPLVLHRGSPNRINKPRHELRGTLAAHAKSRLDSPEKLLLEPTGAGEATAPVPSSRAVAKGKSQNLHNFQVLNPISPLPKDLKSKKQHKDRG